MAFDDDSAARSRFSQADPKQVDRILIAVCAGSWLAALAAGVAAIVALVGLTSGRSVASDATDTPWLLYTVIGVSAAVIIGAIPLLIRARRTSSEPVFGTGPSESGVGSGRPDAALSASPRLEPFGAPVLSRTPIPAAISRVGFPTAAVDQVWTRCSLLIGAAMGAALTAAGVGTYLLASDHDTAAWIFFGLAGLITVATPLAPWFFLRQLRDVLDSSRVSATRAG